jgi:hypothetical protein
MATIDSFDIISLMLQQGGRYPGDPPCSSIWTYWSVLGKKWTYKLFYNARDHLDVSEYVRHPYVLWDDHLGLTALGRRVIQENGMSDKLRDEVRVR